MNRTSLQRCPSVIDMTELIIKLPEEKMVNLREKAATYGVSAEEFVCAGIDLLLERTGDDFEKAAEYVLKKNEELYRKLA